MSIENLLNVAKKASDIPTDAALAKQLGVGRAFLCLVKKGSKRMPQAMKDGLSRIAGIPLEQIETYLVEEHHVDPTLPPVSLVQRSVQHESGMLPDQASDDPAAALPSAAAGTGEEDGREGRSEPPDLVGQSGEGPTPRVTLKLGTRKATVLVSGYVYYPARHSKHSHRRVLSVLHREGQVPAVVYSVGGDSVLVCERTTFIRWMDPTRYHNGQVEINLVADGAAEDKPAKAAAAAWPSTTYSGPERRSKPRAVADKEAS